MFIRRGRERIMVLNDGHASSDTRTAKKKSVQKREEGTFPDLRLPAIRRKRSGQITGVGRERERGRNTAIPLEDLRNAEPEE